MRTGQPIYILADDLTGAADAANYFRTKHRRVRVSFSPSTPWMFGLGLNVVQVFDSESRVLDKDAAGCRVDSAGQQLFQTLGNAFFLFKKIDSTLRGHVGSEIEALLKATGRKIAVLAPSFPANGRTVEHGMLFVNGVPVTQTAFARDPRHPVLQDKVSDIVQQTTNLPVVEISSDVIAEGSQAISRAVEALSDQDTIIVVDAKTDADLASVAKAIAHNPKVIPCGSAGLAKQLVVEWDFENRTSPLDITLNSASSGSIPQPNGSCNRVFIAVGSANPVAHEQLRYAATALGAPTVELEPTRLSNAQTHVAEMEQAKQTLQNVVHQPVIGVSLAVQRAQRDSNVVGTFEGDLAEVIVQGCSTASADADSIIGFVATGGDTALALCKALDAKAIWPEGEVEPGVPWSWIEAGDTRFPLITKAGGFGNIDTLKMATEFLLHSQGE